MKSHKRKMFIVDVLLETSEAAKNPESHVREKRHDRIQNDKNKIGLSLSSLINL